ncbi:uncharacterized protein AUP68_08360 [Ilyonectria robusta]
MAFWMNIFSKNGDGGDASENLHGLFVLYPAGNFGQDIKLDADIIAIHGLNGKAKKTWTDKQSGTFWLEDLLPNAFPTARIMTFGYESGLAFSKSRSGIDTFALDLLNRLKAVRADPKCRGRPLVFIAHSLGGIVVKKALILAHQDQDNYGDIIRSTKGIVFLGTPHRGSDLIPWALLLANLTNGVSLGEVIRTALLKDLDKDSHVLSEISQQFVHRATPLKIRSFVEQRAEPPLNTLKIVPKNCAMLGLPNEVVIPLNASHRTMCRFASAMDQEFSLMTRAIEDIISSEETSITPSVPINTVPGSKVGSHCSSVPEATEDSASLPSNDVKQSQRASPPIEFRGVKSLNTSSPDNTSRSFPFLLRFGTPIPFSTPWESGKIEQALRPHEDSPKSNLVKLRVSGLRRSSVSSESARTTITVHVPLETRTSDIGDHLTRTHPDIEYHGWCFFKVFGHTIRHDWIDVFTTPVEITTGRPCYDVSRGLRINHQQTIASFFSKLYPNPLEVNLSWKGKFGEPSPFNKVASSSVGVGQNGRRDEMVLSFKRTVRIPEDKKTYDLPPDLDNFPVFDIRPFHERLPASLVAQGGLFIPMYQLEAMWINFECKGGHRFVVRPFLGGVNGITGEHAIGDMGSLLRRMNKISSTQDYLVLPEQWWLDGISTAPGIVKQFVAAEMAPHRGQESELDASGNTMSRNHEFSANNLQSSSLATAKGGLKSGESAQIGASVECQVTGRDLVGGIQLQIIPTHSTHTMFAGSMKDVIISGMKDGLFQCYDKSREEQAQAFDVLKTPKELGLEEGDRIHIKNRKLQKRRRDKNVADLFNENDDSVNQSVIDLELEYLDGSAEIFVKPPTGEEMVIAVERLEPIARLKSEIEARCGMPPVRQILRTSKSLKRLEDGKTLAHYSVLPPPNSSLLTNYDRRSGIFQFHGECLKLVAEVEKDVNVLAIAPGGNISQHIERDTNDPRIWDVANSKILNVQLIESRTFRLVTSLDPPKTPITSEIYHELGLPLYQLPRKGNEESKIAGQWGELQGAKEISTQNFRAITESSPTDTKDEHGRVEGGPTVGETENWGLLPSGTWGNKGKEREHASLPGDSSTFTDPSFNFPLELLDADDSIPKFKSVVEEEEEDWADGEMLYD